MCGILGSINNPITPMLLNLIKHRGPDRQDIYKGNIGAQEIHLAHTRLSIVDLSDAGNQPMVSDCGNFILIFNGEIYNHLQLRQSLRFKDFRGHSDTETLLHLLMEQGTDCIQQLNGIFGFAFFDKYKRQLILARDPYGVKPIYYSASKNSLIFSSEIRPIKAITNTSIDIKALSTLLNLRYLPSPYTLYSNISKLRPGHYCLFNIEEDSISYKIISYITPPLPKINISFNDAIKEYGEKLRSAVERQLMGDVEMGILLSGGIDSALVSSLAVHKLGKRIKAFTVGFDTDHRTNELKLAQESARIIGMEYHPIKITSNDFFDSFSECSRIVEEPLATLSLIPMYYLSKIASNHVKVVLTGQGADEPLGGYNRYQGELLYEKYPIWMFKLLNQLIKITHCKKESLIRGARSLIYKNDIYRFLNEYSLSPQKQVSEMTSSENYSRELIEYFYNKATSSDQSAVEKMMSIDMHMNLADDLLLYTDKITMNFSLECRVPMLDLELIKFIQSLPTKYKLQRGKTKIIHSAFARQFLPAEIINRPKLGFQTPAEIWFKENLAQIESSIINGKLKDIIPTEDLHKVISQHKKGYSREKEIFLLLSINEWLNSI